MHQLWYNRCKEKGKKPRADFTKGKSNKESVPKEI